MQAYDGETKIHSFQARIQEGTLNCTKPTPPPNAKINSLIYNTYLFVISCIVNQNLLVVANMQAYNSLTKIRSFQAMEKGEGPRTILALFVGFHVYNQDISHITYICQFPVQYIQCLPQSLN